MPVRRLHNYLYCPRLFYLQWVENIFEENADTAAGSAAHRQTDQPSRFDDDKARALADGLPEGAKLRSLKLESEVLGLVGVVDVVEGGADGACVVDYKKGAARRLNDGTRAAKENDAAQMAAYALLLREHGTPVESAAVYYAEEKRRVPVALTEELFAHALAALAEARAVAASGKMPPPLVDDRRCDFCSAYPVCLPRESAWWAQARERAATEDPQLRLAFPPGDLPPEFSGQPSAENDPMPPPRPPRDDGELLVVQKPGSQVGQRGGEFVVTVQGEVVRKLPLHQVRAIHLYGAVQLTAQAAESCLENGVDVAYFAASGRFLGLLRGLPMSGVDARLGQYRHFEQPFFRLKLARECIRAKVHNQRVMLMRNGDEIDVGDFIRGASGTFLNEQGRRRFWEAWFRRLDAEVSHPEFGYKMSYRRMFEVQARQLWRVVRGDAPSYHGFTTR